MEGFCRGCLIKYDEPTALMPYSEKNRRLFVYCTGLQELDEFSLEDSSKSLVKIGLTGSEVKRNDAFTFQLCKDCFLNMKESCQFKKLCRTSEKKFKNYIALKEDGDAIDFCTFLKNNDESLTLKFPLASANNTPAHNKNKDDDNDSTCTSIRNFMSDILQGEEVPDNEARIIKEVFEEEADVLDDSLDSHWLQDEDDMSIATDFRMDFSFSPFSTPRSINNDHCYTPRRINDDKFTDKSPNRNHDMPNMPLLEVDECAMDPDHVANITMNNMTTDMYRTNHESNISIKNHDLFNKNKEIDLEITFEKDNSNMLVNKDLNTDMYRTNHENNMLVKDEDIFNKDKEIEFGISLDKDNNILLNKHLNILNEDQSIEIDEIVQDDAILVKDLMNTEDSTQEFIAPTEIENDFYKIADDHVKKDVNESKIENELDYYIDKVDMKRKNGENNKCTIDRNLELALLNDQHKEFSLEQLIASPRVSIQSGASTPTIRNILFGNLEPTYDSIENNENNIQEVLTKEQDIIENKIYNTDPLSLRSDLEPVSILIENIKEEIDINTENSVDDIITLINKDIDENLEQNQLPNTDHIKTEDITELIEDYVTNVYETTESKALNNDEIDNLLATVVPKLELAEISQDDKTIEKTGLFKKPMPPDEQYDLVNALCRICDKKFNSEQALRIHFTKIHRVKIKPRKREYPPEVCAVCGKIFKGKANLIRHTKEAHSDIKAKFICAECSLEFKTQYALNVHKRTHKDFVPKKDYEKHLCTFCGKYLSSSNHRLHQLKHQNVYKFQCDQCNKKFNRRWELLRHMGTHTKEHPYACTFCPKAYTRREALKYHLKKHLEKIFSCDTCGSIFKTKSCIRKHFITSVCPNFKEKLNVSLNNIVLIPMSSENKIEITDIKSTDDKTMKNTDVLQMMSIDQKVSSSNDDTPTKKTNGKQMTINDDKLLSSSDNRPMKNTDDKEMIKVDDKILNSTNDRPTKSTDDNRTMHTDKPINGTDVKSLRLPDVRFKIKLLPIESLK